MDMPLNTPLARVEQLLQRSEIGLTIQRITQDAGVTEKEAKASIKALHAMGQIEMIPTPGRWGPRYAWLAAKPTVSESPAVPETELVAGAHDAITGDGSGVALPELPNEEDWAWSDEFAARLPLLSDNVQVDIAKALAESSLTAPATSSAFRELVESQAVAVQPARYAVAVPKRPLRIVKSRERAEALALAAVRRGAKGAEVFALTAVGRAKRDAVLVEQA